MEINLKSEQWTAPVVPENIKCGDMPGDRVVIGETHIQKANVIFPLLLKMIGEKFADQKKITICVCGGSGVGKSEISSLLTYYFESAGIGSYTLSGDNYPRRIPLYNDAERLHIFREGGLKGMIRDQVYTEDRFEKVRAWQAEETDADSTHANGEEWFASYIKGGKEALAGYLGSEHEIRFSEVEEILKEFHAGAEKIWLKRMGRTETDLWYENVDFSDKQVLIVEWTHGNSDHMQGIDIPILLNSTPAETLAYRRLRNRDGKIDSAFTTMVLGLEQNMLDRQAHKAAIIISKQAEVLSYEKYRELWDSSMKA